MKEEKKEHMGGRSGKSGGMGKKASGFGAGLGKMNKGGKMAEGPGCKK